MPDIYTPRLRLAPGTPAILSAELISCEALATALDAELPDSWPPELYDADAVRFTLDSLLAHPDEAAWWFYYVLTPSSNGGRTRPTAIGAGGYKGAPDAKGSVEIGYSICREYRRQGYAREAVDGWLMHAFADARVLQVVAHTLTDLAPSIAVLQSAGFVFNGQGTDPKEPSAVQYVLTRAMYEDAPIPRPSIRFDLA